VKITVDGELFEVVEGQPGEYSFTWLTGPNPGYGFHSASSDGSAMDSAAFEGAIRGFLSQVDPETGFIE
jgi:hypothetical protein